MKIRINVILSVILLSLSMFFLIGCQRGSTDTENNSETEETPQWSISEIDIESLFSDDVEIRVVDDMEVLEERIYMVVTTYEESIGYCDNLVSCDMSGKEVQNIILQKPETGQLLSAKIGLEGNIYAVKYEKDQTVWSCFEDGCSMVSWDSDGNIRFEIRLDSEEFEPYEGSIVNFSGVTEQGELIFTIADFNTSIVVSLSSEGEVIAINDSSESPLKDEVEPIFQVEEEVILKQTIAISDQSYLLYFISSEDHDNSFVGVYLYTLESK